MYGFVASLTDESCLKAGLTLGSQDVCAIGCSRSAHKGGGGGNLRNLEGAMAAGGERERKAAAWGRSSSSRARGLCRGPFGSDKRKGGSQVRFLKQEGQRNGEGIRPRPGSCEEADGITL